MKDLLLIVPPFLSAEIQSLAAHNLQAVSREAGYSCDIEYANISFFSHVGDIFNEFCNMNYFLLGERVFAKAAWGVDVDEQFYDGLYNYRDIYERDVSPIKFFSDERILELEELKTVEAAALDWVDSYVSSLDISSYKFIGVSSSYEQTNASIAILKRIKSKNPGVVTFIGGFNCEGIMGEGIASLDPDSTFIDHIFSGESEVSLVGFLDMYKGDLFPDRIISGKPLINLDDIPDLDYSDYFKHFDDRSNKPLAMETSRGCWWGEKAQCRFCGTSDRVCYREKSTARTLKEIDSYKHWGVKSLHMADLIMPQKNLKELFPELVSRDEGWTLYYEQKSSLSLDEMKLLVDAGAIDAQPGIETLSTDILKKMSKGSSLRQNLRLLREGTTVGLNIYWNMVWGIPKEENREYKKINDLIPLITHLIPPVGIFHMTLVRYSPYLNNPQKYGISDIEPIPSYKKVFPPWAETEKIAIIHRGNYSRETINDTTEIDRLIDGLAKWKESWDNDFLRPRLIMCRIGNGSTIILDTRGVENSNIKSVLDRYKVELLLKDSPYIGSDLQLWALKSHFAIVDNETFIPLVIIDYELRSEYED